MTADEQFKALGYTRVMNGLSHQIIYEHTDRKTQIVVFSICGAVEAFYEGELICMMPGEIRAVCKLLDEIDENNKERHEGKVGSASAMVRLEDAEKLAVKLFDVDETGTEVAVHAIPLEDIRKLKAADMRRDIHAYWARCDDGTYCSHCRRHAIDDIETDFCPDCGAAMDQRVIS